MLMGKRVIESVDIRAIRAFRLDAKLTQKAAATKATMTLGVYHKIESGETANPGVLPLGKVCHALGVQLMEVLKTANP